MKQVQPITFNEILPIWRDYLWPNRTSPIETNSAMNFMGDHDMFNMSTPPTFFAYMIDGHIAGVNSGHMCINKEYRSRGLYVFEEYRGKGIGTLLLKATINRARIENAVMCWSYPKYSSWKTYERAGFELASEFEVSENGTNAYCKILL